MNILAIDPGKTGGAAYFEEDRLNDTYQFSLPSKPRLPTTVDDFQEWVWETCGMIDTPTLCVIEAPVFKRLPTAIQHRVTQNIVYGMQLQAAASQCVHGFVLSEPAAWKGRLGLSDDKKASLKMARELYPDLDAIKLEKNDGVAEAILIGIDYLRQQETE